MTSPPCMPTTRVKKPDSLKRRCGQGWYCWYCGTEFSAQKSTAERARKPAVQLAGPEPRATPNAVATTRTVTARLSSMVASTVFHLYQARREVMDEARKSGGRHRC